MDDEALLAELNDLSDKGEAFALTDEYLAARLVPRYVAAQRMNTCRGCEAYNAVIGQCTVNHWVVPEAAGSNRTDCPKGKW